MASASGLNALYDGVFPYPFQKVRELLAPHEPGMQPVLDLGLGEPRETMPPFVADKIKEAEALFAKYPPIKGSDALRQAIADWIGRRYGTTVGIDAETEILPVNGSREGLFYAAFAAVGRKRLADGVRPAILMCNPYYAAYIGAAFATNAEPVYLNATEASGHLPDLEKLGADQELLGRTAAFYLCSPANPQGAVATRDYLSRVLEVAREHDFMLFLDECYSEIYSDLPPRGGLEVAAATRDKFANLVVFNSLSKRSNLPGLRSGFCAGEGEFLGRLAAIRNLVGPQMPGPTQHASAAVWAEEQHAASNRLAYQEKFAVCDEVLGQRYGYRRPEGGIFLWLDLHHFGGGVDATVTLWQRAGVKVIPGAYLAQADSEGVNPGADYVRVALVQDKATIREALTRVVSVFA